MKAAVVHEYKRSLSIEDVPAPKPAQGEALIRVKAVGVCHSDLHIIDGEIPAPKLPLILGHEIAGEIEEIGESVKGFKIGDRVALSWLWWTCGECDYCLTFRENLCPKQINTGYSTNGGYAEFVKAPASHILKIPDAVNFPEATSCTDAVATPYRALTYASKVKAGDLVAIFGIGGLGLNAVQIAKAFGAKVIAVDINEEKLKLARNFGAEYTVNPTEEDPVKYILDLGGADVALTPVTSLKAMRQAYEIVKAGGTLVLIGLPPGELSLPVVDWILKGKTVVGNIGFTTYEILQSFKLVAEGKVKPLATTFKFEEVNEVLGKLRRGEIVGRAVLTFE